MYKNNEFHEKRDVEKPLPKIPEHLEWFNKFRVNPVSLLLKKSGDPNVRYNLYKIVLRLDAQDMDLLNSKKRLNENGERVRLLIKLEQDVKELREQEKDMSDEQIKMVVLGLNSDLSEAWDKSCHKRMRAIQDAIVYILKTQKEDGSFDFPLHINAYILETLLKYDFEGNAYVEKAIRWLVRQQNSDGGWGDANGNSDIWVTQKVLHACSFHSVMRKREKVLKGAEFILKNNLSENSGGVLEGMNPWDNLSVGYEGLKAFRGGTLRILEVLGRLGYQSFDKRIFKMLEWLEEQQLKNGYWPGVPRLGDDKNEIVTLRVIRVLQLYYLYTGTKKTIKSYRIKAGGRVSAKKPTFASYKLPDLDDDEDKK